MSAIDEVTAAAYRVPAECPEGDGTLAWEATTMVVVTVRAAGVAGTGWTYAPAAAATFVTDTLAGTLTGADADAVPALHAAMTRQVRNAGRPGVAGYAVSAVDVALWDLKARLIGVPLTRLWGLAREEVPLYGSGGFTTYADAATVDQLTHWVHEQGIGRVKIKIGESSGGRPDRDLHRVALARRAIGQDAELYVDANGGYTAKQAVRVAGRMREHGVTWFEEPVSSDDLAGLRLVRERCDADVAAGHHLQVSAHCAPNLHLPAAAATIGLRHLEWFHDHQRIEAELFDGAADPGGGVARPCADAPGHGLTLRTAAAERYRVA
ncbi:enolase C-terminal domain-like protein [Nonomuraea gerenzanensis]|uniref:Mandelate racemase n=1 Tax=Nonomuraea gerenzanensis TaxID=93944 RepID=A0A1M4EAU5_9ACTN|nr:enolase C-terminal domain-like protein [Nonomuraea gerenzanensis]UBU18210.1 mandelate racemase [Nonomuraea gerenzanensis]SBO96025.1 Mandelate racemase [Nonomuraea gerenzanensis]